MEQEEKDRGTYSFNGDVLTLTSLTGSVTTITVKLQGTKGQWSALGFTGWYAEVLPPRDHGPCN